VSPGSLERINPALEVGSGATGDQTLQLHLERYHFAGRHIVPGTVADIACGVGYGSFLMATEYGGKIEKIIAIDNDQESISFAQSKYVHPKISFQTGDAMKLQIPFPLHNVVSLETLEHLPDPALFIKAIAALMVSGGRVIASVPVTPSMDANPYHLHDFTRQRFRKMFGDAGFSEIHSFIQKQGYNPITIMGRKEARSKDIRKGIFGYYLRHPGKFFLRLRSLFADGFTNKYMVAVFEKL
jgi:SAM-dependent methyltransferase